MTLTSAESALVQLLDKIFNYSNGFISGDYRVKSKQDSIYKNI